MPKTTAAPFEGPDNTLQIRPLPIVSTSVATNKPADKVVAFSSVTERAMVAFPSLINGPSFTFVTVRYTVRVSTAPWASVTFRTKESVPLKSGFGVKVTVLGSVPVPSTTAVPFVAFVSTLQTKVALGSLKSLAVKPDKEKVLALSSTIVTEVEFTSMLSTLITGE